MRVINFLSLNEFWTSEGFREEGFKNPEIPEGWGGGGHHKPSGMEIPRGWGVKIKKPSLGGVWIFSETAQYSQLDSSGQNLGPVARSMVSTNPD